jgi:alkylation response protein AidB-like acyl-CoA dehydrogenase
MQTQTERGHGEDRGLLRETVAKFVEQKADLGLVRHAPPDGAAFNVDLWRQGAVLGWTAMLVSETYGGGSITDAGLLDALEIAEVLGRYLLPVPFLSTNVVAAALSQEGSDDLRARFLPRIVTGELVGAWCLSEGSGSVDPADVSMLARIEDGEYVLEGTKCFVPDADTAEILLVTARAEDGGLTQLVVDADSPGVSVSPLVTMDPSRRIAHVHFDSVRVGADRVLGAAGAATIAVARQLATALVLQCADSVGALSFVNDMTFEYAKDRFAFGRPIGSFQAIKHKCTDMYLAFLGAQAITASAAEAVETWTPDASHLASIAKAYVGEALSMGAEHCHQIHGGIAFTWEHDAHLYTRRSKFNEAMFGSPDWHRDQLGRALGL